MPSQTKATKNKQSLLFLSYIAVGVLLGLSISNLQLYFNYKNTPLPQVLGERSDQLNEDKRFWQDFVSDNPTYLDGWIMLTKVNLELGNLEEAKVAFEKARIINPNSEKVSELKGNF